MLAEVSTIVSGLTGSLYAKLVASVTYHLHSEDALFARAIIMSGTWFLTGPLGFDDHERNYWLAMEALGLKDKTGEERVKALLEMPAEDLLAKLPPSVLIAPAIDGDMVLSHPTHSQVVDRGSTTPKGKRWCKDLMIGDAQMDVSR